MSQPQGSIPPHMPRQFGPPPQQQFGPPPWQQHPGAIPPQHWQSGPPIDAPRRPVSLRPEVGGWWIGSAVLAFLGAGWALLTLGSIIAIAGFIGVFVGAQGGGEGLRQISDDLVQTTNWSFYLFLGIQFVSIVVGFWGGRNCLRGKTSGVLMTMSLGVLGLAESLWLGLRDTPVTGVALGAIAAVAMVVCPVLAVRRPST